MIYSSKLSFFAFITPKIKSKFIYRKRRPSYSSNVYRYACVVSRFVCVEDIFHCKCLSLSNCSYCESGICTVVFELFDMNFIFDKKF